LPLPESVLRAGSHFGLQQLLVPFLALHGDTKDDRHRTVAEALSIEAEVDSKLRIVR
jgi:predicted HAD superfamily phosphohydrolase